MPGARGAGPIDSTVADGPWLGSYNASMISIPSNFPKEELSTNWARKVHAEVLVLLTTG